jgi:hypothetical protein
MSQLAFPFAAADPPAAAPSRTTRYWRRRIDRAVRRAFELGTRQCQRRPLEVAPLPTRKFYPTHAERDELQAIATRVARLTVSHKTPERFFEDKSELAHAIRQIARRSGATGVPPPPAARHRPHYPAAKQKGA